MKKIRVMILYLAPINFKSTVILLKTVSDVFSNTLLFLTLQLRQIQDLFCPSDLHSIGYRE
jgi:hypothetical protein